MTVHVFRQDQSGATAIEYAMIAAVLATVIAAGFSLVGGGMGDLFASVSGAFSGLF